MKNSSNKIYLSIRTNKIFIVVKNDSNQILYKNEARVINPKSTFDLNFLNEFIKTNIFKIEKVLNEFVKDIYIIIAHNKIYSLKFSIKNKTDNIELNNDYANNDTYAWLLFKLGEHEKALKQAEKTIQIAKKNNEDYSETAKIITELSNK